MSIINEIIKETGKFGVVETIVHIASNLGMCNARKFQELRAPYYKSLDAAGRRAELESWYKKQTGKELNLDNPQTVTEAVQWLKLYDPTDVSLKTRLADKYLVREWIKETIGEKYLVHMYGAWDSFDEIDFDCIPSNTKFVLKGNHGSGMTLIVDSKESMDMAAAKKEVESWLEFSYGWDGFEMQYLDIPRKVIAEEYIVQSDGDLKDYKIHCFNGKPAICEVIGNRDLNKHTASENVYDPEWNTVPVQFRLYTPSEKEEPMPAEYPEMIRIAEALSKGIPYVRVDLYLLEDGIRFGEMTFTPSNGLSTGLNEAMTEKLDELRTLWENKRT